MLSSPCCTCPSDITDEVTRAREGDQAAFANMIERLMPHMYRLARTVLRNEHDCADALQEAVLRAWLNLPSLRDGNRVMPWLHRIVYRECCRIARRATVRRETALEFIADIPQDENADILRLRAALDELPLNQRTPLVLHYLSGFGIKDIAFTLKVPQGTVKTRMMRGRQHLAKILKEDM